MRKPSFAVAFALLLALGGVSASFQPTRVAFPDLVAKEGVPNDDKTVENDAKILSALRSDGILSITDVPSLSKLQALTSLAICADASSAAREHTFPDGTVRRTLATHSVAGEPYKNIDHGPNAPASCEAFDEAAQAFRQTVEVVTEAFAARLQRLLASSLHHADEPLLHTSHQNKAYYDMESIAKGGEHLEHFHTYYKDAPENHVDQETTSTIDWHVDQGLFLLFTPGLIDSKTTGGFYIQLPDGSREMVDFCQEDDLVILLGDGVQQILNPLLAPESSLRVPPHSLVMPRHGDTPRVWYGRMVLPPSDALHPTHHHETYGQLRHDMIQHNNNNNNGDDSLALGCSSTLQSRHLNEADCDPDLQYFCWHRCFNNTQDNVTVSSCEVQGLDLACINDQRQLWNGAHDPSFYPGCVDLETATVAPNGSATHHGGNGTTGHNQNNTTTSGASEIAGTLLIMGLVFVLSGWSTFIW